MRIGSDQDKVMRHRRLRRLRIESPDWLRVCDKFRLRKERRDDQLQGLFRRGAL